MKMKTYSVRFDAESRQLMVVSLAESMNQLERFILDGTADENTMRTFDSLMQIRRGLLAAPAEEVDVPDPEQPELPEPTEAPE